MIISTLTWALVSIDYEQPVPVHDGKPKLHEEIRDAYVSYKDDGSCALTLEWGDGHGHMLLAEAKVIKISPWEMEFEACWWSAKEKSKTYDQLIPCKVICKFEGYKRFEIERERREVEWILKEAKKRPIQPIRNKDNGSLGIKAAKPAPAKKPVCKRCKGRGRITVDKGDSEDCPKCHPRFVKQKGK